MATTGLMFEKDKPPLSNEILSLFEKVRVAYLSARTDKREYGERWRNAITEIKSSYDSLSPLGREIKVYLEEKKLNDDDTEDPESVSAKLVYDAIKQMRFSSKRVDDPFAKKFKDDVLEALLTDMGVLVNFIHYAIRRDSDSLPSKAYQSADLEPDEITEGIEGMDLSVSDVDLFIIEHYGDDKDTKKVESKVKQGLDKLKEVYAHGNSEEEWDRLTAIFYEGEEIELKKAEKSQEKKANVHFIVPNKPMYRIFDLEDINELRGFTGEYVVQEKYDGMRIQLHKISKEVRIFSYNEKDITDKCPNQVKELQKKEYGDCILDAELILFDGDKPLHRADTIAHVFKGQYPDAELRTHVFDIMRHEGDDITDEPLRMRIQLLFNNYSAKSSDAIAYPSKKDTRIADNLNDVGEYAKEIMEMPTAEGVVIKDIESTYFIGTKKNPKWIKWKKFVDLDLIVLDVKKTKSNLYSYTLGAGPVEEDGKGIQELNGKFYMNVGKALNTKIKTEVGEIIRVKVDEVKGNKDGYTLYSAKVIEIPEIETPDKIVTLEMLSKDTKPSLKYNVEALKKGIMISDNIHGMATLIAKNMDGFTIYGFEEDNLMAKNALLNLDSWKEQAQAAIIKLQGELGARVMTHLKERGGLNVKELHNYLVTNHAGDYETLLDSDYARLKGWAKNTGPVSFNEEDKLFVANENIVLKKDEEPIEEKEPVKEPVEEKEPVKEGPKEETGSDKGIFKLYSRKDANLDLLIKYKGEILAWKIQLPSDDAIFSLFGKANKYPAEISKNISREKLLDSGSVTIGAQRHGYHEYILDGNKFETKLHFRVVTTDSKKMWLVWTGYEQSPVPESADDGVWNIYEDRFKHIKLPPNEDKA
tara:strand:+ start:770 stop:3376 length:2607 start_codon:yes stop_codon:yes gene_type:complete